jgi:hypothetical protein
VTIFLTFVQIEATERVRSNHISGFLFQLSANYKNQNFKIVHYKMLLFIRYFHPKIRQKLVSIEMMFCYKKQL